MPCSAALVQCSRRISTSKSGLGQRATSPAATRAGGGRHLRPDEAGAHDHDPPVPVDDRVEPGLDGQAVVNGPQQVNAVERGRAGEDTGDGSTREDEAVEAEPGPPVELDAPSVHIEGGGRTAELQLQSEVVVPVVAQNDLLDRALAGQ